jgi:hypothetical protein
VVDDKARRGPNAARSQPFAIAVACQDEDVHALRGGHDLAFHAPAARLESRWSSKARLGLGE